MVERPNDNGVPQFHQGTDGRTLDIVACIPQQRLQVAYCFERMCAPQSPGNLRIPYPSLGLQQPDQHLYGAVACHLAHPRVGRQVVLNGTDQEQFGRVLAR